LSKQQRRQYSAEEKVKHLRRHLIDKVPVSVICNELRLSPTVFYRWQDQLFGNAAGAFDRKRGREERDDRQQKIERLEKKIQQKDEVLAELMAEHVALKKSLGEL
jgi:transposase